MTFKRIAVSLCTIMICMMMFIGGYMKSTTLNSYAADSNWQNVTTNEQLVQAFKYYCKSRNVVIEGSLLDGVTKFTTNTFNGLCKGLGIDVDRLQAEIKYTTDGNNGIKFLFSTTGITAYNRIFAEFLQNNNLEVGDTNVNKPVYSGDMFTDADGISCLVYYVDTISSSGNSPHTPLKLGTYYKYDTNDLLNMNTASYNVTSTFTNSYPILRFNSADNATYRFVQFSDSATGVQQEISRMIQLTSIQTNGVLRYGYRAILYNTTTNKYYFGHFLNVCNSTNEDSNLGYYWYCLNEITPDNITPNVNINIVSNVINNNNYEGDTIINNDGTPDNNDPDPDPDYDPYPDGGGTTTGPGSGGGSGSGGTITFPDLDLDLPSINWSLGDLSEKFPFSIPFDLIAFFTVLNAQPEAPAIDAEIPLGSWYTWHFEADFSQFDNYAAIIRNVEFIGFCVALIYLTIRLIKA